MARSLTLATSRLEPLLGLTDDEASGEGVSPCGR